MTHVDPDRMALVALGEEITTPHEAAHLVGCPDCAAELEDLSHTAAVGRASLDGTLETPSPRVWDRIVGELGFASAPSLVEPASDVAPVYLRRADLRDAATRRPWVWVLAAAAAVAIVAGVGVGVSAWLRPAVVQLASATLDALPDHAGASGSAAIDERADGSRVLTLSLDSSTSSQGYREVWLMNEDASELISLGLLAGDRGDFVIPQNVDLERYELVDVSEEPADGDPGHSGDSIVRGQLQFS